MRNVVCRKKSDAGAAAAGGGKSSKQKPEKKGRKKEKKQAEVKEQPRPKRGRKKKENPQPKKKPKPDFKVDRSLLGQVGEAMATTGDPEFDKKRMHEAKEKAGLTKIEQTLIWSEKHVGKFNVPVCILS